MLKVQAGYIALIGSWVIGFCQRIWEPSLCKSINQFSKSPKMMEL